MMSNRLVEDVFKHSQAKGVGKAIMVYLAYRADDQGNVWTSIKRICEEMSISRNSVFKNLIVLEEIGELIRLTKQGKFGTNQYHVRVLNSTNNGTNSVPNLVQYQKEDSTKSGTVNSTNNGTNSVPNLVHNKPQSPTKPLKKVNQKRIPVWFQEFFDHFWKEYPNKAGKKNAHAKLKILFLDSKDQDALKSQIMDGLERWKNSRQWQNPEYIPHGSTWVNQEKWEDQPEQKCQIQPRTIGTVETNYKTDSPLALTTDPIADLERLRKLQAEGKRVPDWKIEATKKLIEEMKAEGATK